MLKVAQTKIPYPIYLIKGITQKLPFKENKFDIILCINLLVNLEGIEDVRKTIENTARIAKEDALIFIEYRNKLNPGMSYQCYKKKKRQIPHPYNAYSIFQIKKILKENNLMIKEKIPVFPDKSSSKLKGILYSLYSLFIYNKLFSPCIILKVSPKPKKDAL
jgi:ubiquinone/menaquinone biosynthesis C-methylase UbiE